MASDEVANYFSSGRAYCDAAQIVFASAETLGRDYLILPTHTLLGVSLETLFKAILLHKGVTQKELSSLPLRHDLKALSARAKKEGFVSKTRIGEIVDHISDNYGKHEYRYMKVNSSVNRVNGSNAVQEINDFMEEVRKEVGL